MSAATRCTRNEEQFRNSKRRLEDFWETSRFVGICVGWVPSELNANDFCPEPFHVTFFVFYDFPTSSAREKLGKVRGAWRDIIGCCSVCARYDQCGVHPGKQNQVLSFLLCFLLKPF